MLKQGTIKRWDPERGFGFIRSPATPVDVFFHLKAFKSSGGLPPREGMAVRFDDIHVGGKGPRATVVHPQVSKLSDGSSPASQHRLTGDAELALVPIRSTQQKPRRPVGVPTVRAPGRPVHHSGRPAPSGVPPWVPLLMWALILVWLGFVIYGVKALRLPVWSFAVLALLNVATLFAYAFDKNAAEQHRWRTREDTLHIMALAGGWPAAWLAQRLLRHKTSKESFQAVYWITVIGNCACLGLWLFWLPQQFSMPFK